MTINQKIENALSDYVNGKIYPLSCPLEETPDVYITYNPEVETAQDYGDDIDNEWLLTYQIHWFAKGITNYQKAKMEIRSLLRSNGFTLNDLYIDFEEKRKITHLVYSVNIIED